MEINFGDNTPSGPDISSQNENRRYAETQEIPKEDELQRQS